MSDLIKAVELFRQHHEGRRATAESLIERATAEIASIDQDLEQLRQVEELLSGDGDGAPPTPPPELKPSDDVPPPEQQASQAPAGEPSQPGDSAGNGTGPAIHDASGRRLRPQQITRLKNREALLEYARYERRHLTWTDLFDALVGPSGMSTPQLRGALNDEVDEGNIEKTGAGRGVLYRAVERVEPVTPPAEVDRPTGDQYPEGSVEGAILTLLQLRAGGMTAPAISLELEQPLNDLRPVLGKLLREGEIRTQKKGPDTLYVKALVPA